MKAINLLFHYNFGGAEKVAENYSHIFNIHGVKVKSLALKGDKNSCSDIEIVSNKVSYLRYCLSNLKYNDIIICHCNFSLLITIFCMLFTNLKNSKKYYVQHLEYTPWKRAILYRIINLFFDGFIEIKNESYPEINLISRTKIIPIHNFTTNNIKVSLNETEKDAVLKTNEAKMNGDKIILFVGSAKEGKGINHLITISKYLSKLNFKYKILFVGDGPLLFEFKNQINMDESIADSFIFSGFSSSPEKFIQLSNIMIFPSDKSEVTPMVVLEALDNNLPVTAFDFLFNQRYLPSQCLFKINMIHEMAEYIMNGDYTIIKNMYNQEYAISRFIELIGDTHARN
ncbi:glycosyltransferase [Providencia rettgeri]|uniref:glycosyltransferase n=1 Tax=Providencia rettgeri TaxID=587 RepID=UPI0013740DD2|nr:glycosyltransferase [Providencia rettgeri]BBV06423.1 hypothetical protein BML2531_41990 [Providencia rettgeri]